MALTKSEIRTLAKIREWEEQFLRYEPTDIELTVDKWMEYAFERLDHEARENFFEKLDNWLYHVHAFLQSTEAYNEARERIISDARIFSGDISTLADVRKLSLDQIMYLSRQQSTRSRLISVLQGGVSGTGSLLLTGADIPAMTLINLRAVQLIAMTYGYDVRIPSEMMISLKLFHIATLPKRFQKDKWEELIEEVASEEPFYFYEGDDKLTDEAWLKQPVKQLLKGLVIMAFRKKSERGLPLLGIAIGASANYLITKKVTQFAEHFYQLRVIMEKSEERSATN